jgi:TolB-like protein
VIEIQAGEQRIPSSEDIMDQLDRILQSKAFQRASRMRSLLKYVVTGFTEGRAGGQSQMARQLFGRDDAFDPSLDPVIRVQFGRLRKALENYYSTEGKKDPIIIDIPNRRYTPVFQNVSSIGVNGHAAETDPNGRPPHPPIAPSMEDSEGDGVRTTIAVLPFANLTAESAQDAFCYGLTEEIANLLAGVTSLDVVASSSTFQFKDQHVDVRTVGRELGVSLILEGSVRMEEGHARVIAQLARSEDGVVVWSDSFDDTMNGSLATQNSIAQKVMETLPLTECAA